MEAERHYAPDGSFLNRGRVPNKPASLPPKETHRRPEVLGAPLGHPWALLGTLAAPMAPVLSTETRSRCRGFNRYGAASSARATSGCIESETPPSDAVRTRRPIPSDRRAHQSCVHQRRTAENPPARKRLVITMILSGKHEQPTVQMRLRIRKDAFQSQIRQFPASDSRREPLPCGCLSRTGGLERALSPC